MLSEEGVYRLQASAMATILSSHSSPASMLPVVVASLTTLREKLIKIGANVVTCPKDALLYVPSHPARELDKDLEIAGIPKSTSEGKIAFHALRTSFVTLTYEAGATHKEAQELARHATPGLTANTYARTRNERLAGITERVADTVLSGDLGANMVHQTGVGATPKGHKCFPINALTANMGQWRRGDSNPRPEMFQDKRLHA